MKSISDTKAKIKSVIIDRLAPIPGMLSITFVGSFETARDLSLISDIDIIVIVDRLTAYTFKEIENAAQTIEGKDIGLNDHQIKLNLSFGPLKFNDAKTAVFHLMVYDVVAHRKHVLESPFTCLDWEFFPAAFGKNLTDIYSAMGVQLGDLIGSRRGLEAYLDDLKSGQISYRTYVFNHNKVEEQKQTFPMDERHQKEYAFHVIKFLQLNLLKILLQANLRLSVEEIAEEFQKLSPEFKTHSRFLVDLYSWKYNNGPEPEAIFSRLENFIHELSAWLSALQLPGVTFFRHGKTALNDGSFLGQGRNPGIITPVDFPETEPYNEVITGTLLRTIESGALLKSDAYRNNDLLNEIDYGAAEGMQLQELKKHFPEIVEAWAVQQDPRFPEGENQEDVHLRLKTFLQRGFAPKRTAVVSHNVVLRALLGQTYGVQMHHWYKLNPGHLEPHDFKVFGQVLIPSFPKTLQAKYKDAVSEYMSPKVSKYGVFWIPGPQTSDFVQKWKDLCRALEPDATYLEHPVHATFFLFHARERDEAALITAIEPFSVHPATEDWLVFEKDSATNGDTLTVAIKRTEELITLQKNIAEKLLPFCGHPIDYSCNWEGPFKASYSRYGFPFVGEHWRPHLSIASLSENGRPLINKAKATIPPANDPHPGHFALYKIQDQEHICIHTWTINPKTR